MATSYFVRGMLAASLLQALSSVAAENQPPTPPPPPPAASGTSQAMPSIPVVQGIPSKMSLLHVGGNDTFAITPEGRKAGTLLYQALTTRKGDAQKLAQEAIELWNKIIPQENYGGEYSALQWFATYLVSDAAQRGEMIKDPYVNEFFHFFGDNKYAVLKEYLKRKYHAADIGDEETYTGQTRKALLEDTILFNNPRREEWEKTSAIMGLIDLKPGDTIADIGSGPGYYTFRFAQKVGPSGKVYAIDTVENHLKHVSKIAKATGIDNVTVINTDGKTIGLVDQKVDAVFMCSLYHNIYGMSTEPEREELIASIKDALKDDGVLYIVDNGLVPPGTLPYHGPYIAKELIIQQLTGYGFKLILAENKIPQRYILAFKKEQVGKHSS